MTTPTFFGRLRHVLPLCPSGAFLSKRGGRHLEKIYPLVREQGKHHRTPYCTEPGARIKQTLCSISIRLGNQAITSVRLILVWNRLKFRGQRWRVKLGGQIGGSNWRVGANWPDSQIEQSNCRIS